MIWYASTIANRANVNFIDEVLFANVKRLQGSHIDKSSAPAPLLSGLLATDNEIDSATALGIDCVSTFGKYQQLAVKASRFAHDRSALVPYLVQIWQNVGDLLRPFGITPNSNTDTLDSKDQIAKSLGDVMWYVAGFAELYDLSLDDIATANVQKILSAFPPDDRKQRTQLYDDGLAFLEQFPREFTVRFVEQDDQTAVMLINDVRVGDPLTDNAYSESNDENRRIEVEGYRYHDAVHLAFAAVLGWSPVTRRLLKRKRKSLRVVDQVEDGARAQIVEEMIVKIAHSYAVGHDKHKLLDGRDHVNLNLLKQIAVLAEGLEVAGSRHGHSACKYWEWQEAILSGFKVYNDLRRNRGGYVQVNLETRSVTFQPEV